MRCHETGSFEIHLICKVYKTSCWLCWETSSSSGLISLSSSSLLKLCCVGLELSGVVWSLRLSSNVSSSSAATAIDFNLRLASSLAKLFLIHLVSQFQPLLTRAPMFFQILYCKDENVTGEHVPLSHQ